MPQDPAERGRGPYAVAAAGLLAPWGVSKDLSGCLRERTQGTQTQGRGRHSAPPGPWPPGVLRGGGARTAGMHTPSGVARSCEHRLGCGSERSGSERFGVMNTASDETRTIR